MHTERLFPAVCFWKDLISDAVKYWFSLTSVKTLIFLLRLNNLSNKICFFGFLGFHKWFHIFFPHCRVFAHASPPPPNLWLSLLIFQIAWAWYFICVGEAQRWWSWKLTRQVFLWLRSLFVERVEKSSSPQNPLEESRKSSWPRRTRFKQSFCSSRKHSTYRKCSIALLIVCSMSAWFDNRCLSLSPCLNKDLHTYIHKR